MDVSTERVPQGGGPVLVRRRSPVPLGLREMLKARLWQSCTCSTQRAWALLQGLLPATRWLCQYRPREALAGDVMSGLVIGIILVPQAIAYSLLAGLQPIYSLYTSFFANLIYFLMGTSHHVSVGIFSLLCLMVGQVVDRELLLAGFGPAQDGPGPRDNGSSTNASATIARLRPQDCEQDCYAIRVATALTLVAGIYQVRGRPGGVLPSGERAPPGLTAHTEGPSAGQGRVRASEDGEFNQQGQDRTGRSGHGVASQDGGTRGSDGTPEQGPCPASSGLDRNSWLEGGSAPDVPDWPAQLPCVSCPRRDPERLPLFLQPPHTQGSPEPGLSCPPQCHTLPGGPGVPGGGQRPSQDGRKELLSDARSLHA